MCAFLPAARGVGDRADLLRQPLTEGERRDEQLAELRRPPEPGQVVEEIGDVVGDRLVGGEQAEVLVDAGGERVVVAGAEVDIAAQPPCFAPNDERRLRVDLQRRKAVDDVDACLLHRADHSMFRRSSPRALISTRHTVCFPFSCASISAGTSGDSSLVR